MQKQIIIAGPTASGKTSLSLRVAKELNAEIISVDSRQCYKYLDIGTAKPTHEELSQVKHHNISILNPDEPDSVASFKDRADQYAADIETGEKPVIFCGGSTLHLQSLIHPMDDIPSADPKYVDELSKLADQKGIEYLYSELERVDPAYAAKMDGKNRQRIIRALDVWRQTGKSFSSFHSDKPFILPDDKRLFVLHHPRKKLHDRIAKRTEWMFKNGIIEETENILNQGYEKTIQSLQTVGYREVIRFLEGEISEDQMIEKVKTSTRRYAKRQITWFRRWPFATLLDMDSLTEEDALKEIVGAFQK